MQNNYSHWHIHLTYHKWTKKRCNFEVIKPQCLIDIPSSKFFDLTLVLMLGSWRHMMMVLLHLWLLQIWLEFDIPPTCCYLVFCLCNQVHLSEDDVLTAQVASYSKIRNQDCFKIIWHLNGTMHPNYHHCIELVSFDVFDLRHCSSIHFFFVQTCNHFWSKYLLCLYCDF